MLRLKETIDQLAMAKCVRWYGHVLRRQDSHVLRRALDFEVESQRKKGRPRMTWKKTGQGREYDGWFEMESCTLPFKVEGGVNKIAAGLR